MSDFVEKLRLKELAEEDIYFAQHDLELIDALHQKRLATHANCETPHQREQAKAFEARYAAMTDKHDEMPHRSRHRELLHGLRELLDEIKRVCRHGH